MQYESTRFPGTKEFPADVLVDVRAYIERSFPEGVATITKGELQDALLAFRTKDGNRLLLNQLAPIFVAYCRDFKI